MPSHDGVADVVIGASNFHFTLAPHLGAILGLPALMIWGSTDREVFSIRVDKYQDMRPVSKSIPMQRHSVLACDKCGNQCASVRLGSVIWGWLHQACRLDLGTGWSWHPSRSRFQARMSMRRFA